MKMKRILSLMLCLLLVLGNFAGLGVQLEAATANAYGETNNKIADPATVNNWKDLFLTPGANNTLTTEHAGGMWTDKSVFNSVAEYKSATAEEDDGIALTLGENNFLVALSAIGTSKSIEGYNTLPSDTMLVLDLSGSMRNSGSVSNLIAAANDAIERLQNLNANNRVGVVAYAQDAQVILPLGRYMPVQTARTLSPAGEAIEKTEAASRSQAA